MVLRYDRSRDTPTLAFTVIQNSFRLPTATDDESDCQQYRRVIETRVSLSPVRDDIHPQVCSIA